MYAGEIIYLLLWMLASAGIAYAAVAVVLGIGWSIFHVLIVLLQAYIFMMLTIVYLAMAHESH
jgi:F-type H+-transporting ATPase subunit a